MAIFTSNPISDRKKTRTIRVLIANIASQTVFFFRKEKFKSSLVFAIARGEASKHVSVVLNMVVKAAKAIIKKAPLPRFVVYKSISCFENVTP